MKRLFSVMAVAVFLLSACSADSGMAAEETTGDKTPQAEDKKEDSTLGSLVNWGKGAVENGGKLADQVAQEMEALSLLRLGDQLSDIAVQLETEAVGANMERAKEAVNEAEKKLEELEGSINLDSGDAAALIKNTRATLNVTATLLSSPESRQDMVEIAKNLYQVSKNLKKLSSMVQTSPAKLAWKSLPGAVKYLRNNDFGSIRGDVEGLSAKLQASAETGLSIADIRDLEGLVSFITALARNLDDNLNSSGGREFSDKFKPNIHALRQTMDETQPLMDDPEKNITQIVKNLNKASGNLRELSEITLEFPEYLKLWPAP